jgi:hypothetical protein
MTLGIFPRVTWNRLLAEAGFGQVMIAAVSGRDVFQATGQPGPVEQGATSATPSLRY